MEVFKELGSVKKTAQFLTLHYNTVYDIVKSSSGLCINCHKQAKPGHRRCVECSAKDAERMKAKRKERALNGLCSMCGEPRSRLSPAYCDRHRIMAASRSRANKDATRGRGVPVPHIVSQEKRAKDLLKRYGQAAVDTMLESGWRCEVCDTPDTEVSVQVHHIDENPSNGEKSNLAALCFYCHRATHVLLKVKDDHRLLGWLKKAYPGRY